MSLFDSLLNTAFGAAAGNANSPALIAAVVSYVTSQPGGIAGFITKLQQGGLGEAVASWVGSGPNQAVSGEQIGQALGADALQQLAQHTGGNVDAVAGQLAQLLPHLINHATPDGTVPANASPDLAQQLLSALPGLLAGRA
jgi:uncharacterized protein YidB (DUF937 family)